MPKWTDEDTAACFAEGVAETIPMHRRKWTSMARIVRNVRGTAATAKGIRERALVEAKLQEESERVQREAAARRLQLEQHSLAPTVDQTMFPLPGNTSYRAAPAGVLIIDR